MARFRWKQNSAARAGVLAGPSVLEARAARAGQVIVVEACWSTGTPSWAATRQTAVVRPDRLLECSTSRLEGPDAFRDQGGLHLPVVDRVPDAAQCDVLLLREGQIHVPHRRGIDVDAVAGFRSLPGRGCGPDHFDLVTALHQPLGEASGEDLGAADDLWGLRRRIKRGRQKNFHRINLMSVKSRLPRRPYLQGGNGTVIGCNQDRCGRDGDPDPGRRLCRLVARHCKACALLIALEPDLVMSVRGLGPDCNSAAGIRRCIDRHDAAGELDFASALRVGRMKAQAPWAAQATGLGELSKR